MDARGGHHRDDEGNEEAAGRRRRRPGVPRRRSSPASRRWLLGPPLSHAGDLHVLSAAFLFIFSAYCAAQNSRARSTP
ncbi:hypothetical protein OsJ_36542 [Oryza sativa Japonica Group]|uniref:Uncharacterized protein n=1 Tax=Oryza sativa subsp. japonica TaxID=39947 RepID=B9GDT9_ORYSJ|nr:hypothetical protein OsJ_36542 [Oryza sativa Japonica Group]